MPVDLLADRSAESLETWLKARPGVRVISGDRAGAYADGAAKGAPDTVQVADRFHLLCNLTAAVERSLESRGAELHRLAEPRNEENQPAPAETPAAEADRKTRSERQKENGGSGVWADTTK